MSACIFDLDGVITDTAEHHFYSWKKIAEKFGFDLQEERNEELKGVSRKESLLKITSWAGVKLKHAEIEDLLRLKNEIYLESIGHLSASDILPGVEHFLSDLKQNGIHTAIGSSSKNARFILDHLGLTSLFPVISDGNSVVETKPNPAVFLMAAQLMEVPDEECVVFEDAVSGVEAARSAGMKCVGIGKPEILSRADACISTLEDFTFDRLKQLLS
ncbi:MAG: beta-phosphoglucomutase [Bacteroidetes bacterium]|nr:beta-phosphoglucomutase [Bacteroidota bacterium]